MLAAYIAVGMLTAAACGAAAAMDFTRPAWLLENMNRVGVGRPWLYPLGLLKLAGAVGLVVGIAVPALGVAAALGLVLFFAGAISTHVRAGDYASIPFPGVFLLLAAATFVVRLISG